MYIGKMGSNSYLNRIGLNHSGRNQNSTFLKWNQSFTRRDSVMKVPVLHKTNVNLAYIDRTEIVCA